MNDTERAQELQETPAPEELAEMEAAREAQEEAIYGAARNAAKLRRQSAAIIAEHDELLADILYEMTMNELGEG